VQIEVANVLPRDVAKTTTGKAQAEAEASAEKAKLAASEAQSDAAAASQLLTEATAQQHTVPIGGIVMWWGNWEADKGKLQDYELCDGGNVYEILSKDVLGVGASLLNNRLRSLFD
jgi:hypothetical protein